MESPDLRLDSDRSKSSREELRAPGQIKASPARSGDLKRCFLRPGAPPDQERLCRTLVVNNLSPFATEAVVRSGLSQFGVVDRITLPRHPLHTECESMGWGFVEMASVEDAKNAIFHADRGIFLLGAIPRPVEVRLAKQGDFESGGEKSPPKLCLNDSDLVELKNLRYKHLAQQMFLRQLQSNEAWTLHDEQEDRLRHYLRLSDALSGFEFQKQIKEFYRFFK